MTKLLVSVRDAEEARAALIGGADIIDVKEPFRGPLGRADDAVIGEVIASVAGRVPVSAAMGELTDDPPVSHAKLDFVKVGLANIDKNWRERWSSWSQLNNRTQDQEQRAVLVAYSDVHNVEEFLQFANEVLPAVFLLDTACKDGRTLLDDISVQELASLRQRCLVPFAVAGSLGPAEVEQLLPIQPDIIAVRGAVCHGGRQGTVDCNLVLQLSSRLAHMANAG
jgi:(5-formylfuran-3-yl)methyl phosphate synthase